MKLHSNSIEHGAAIHPRLAFCAPDPTSRVALSTNLSPHLAWSELPSGTKSLVILCHDPDVPSRGDDVNQEGREVPPSLPRVDFFHWVLVDVDPALGELAEGAFSSGVTARGKAGPEGPLHTRQGVNNYTDWFASDPSMSGDYYGYDGPCPPWNDSIVHHYWFTAFAVDWARCPLAGRFGGPEVRSALEGHVLGSAAIMGTYTLNPRLLGR
jgi:hypothetical protein